MDTIQFMQIYTLVSVVIQKKGYYFFLELFYFIYLSYVKPDTDI